MRQFALFLALAALLFCGAFLPACVDTDGDGIPDAPPGVGDDDVVGSDDDDDSVAIVTLPLAVSTGSCEVELFGADLQVAVSHPEARGDKWSTPVPPHALVPADGNWWRVEVYAVGFTLAQTFVRLEGGNAYQSEAPEGEGVAVTQVAMAMHYNFSSLCGDAQEYGNAECTPSSGGDRWHIDFTLSSEEEVFVSMGPYNPLEQEVVNLGWSNVEVNGCTLTFHYDEANSFDAAVDPAAHEFTDEWGDFVGYRL